MRIHLITTTINVPEVLGNYARAAVAADVHLKIYVAGDYKSPHGEIRRVLRNEHCSMAETRYIHPDDQRQWKSSDAIGWNSIQRRNIALLEALTDDEMPDYVTTIDDDNWPADNYFREVKRMFSGDHCMTVSSPSGWYDICQLLDPPIHHRGYPYTERTPDEQVSTGVLPVNPAVVAGLWTGDPDIDAMERMVNRPYIKKIPGAIRDGIAPAVGTWMPFNSQNTTWVTKYAPLMYVWPFVGRMDDIWASYLARAILDAHGRHVIYGEPVVQQDRNPHDDVLDVERELIGYRHTHTLCEALRSVKHDDNMWTMMERGFDVISHFSFLPSDTLRAFDAWLLDTEQLRSRIG